MTEARDHGARENKLIVAVKWSAKLFAFKEKTGKEWKERISNVAWFQEVFEL